MGDRVKEDYEDAQEDVYSIHETGWENYDDHQPEFEAFKPKYTTQYSIDAKEAIVAAREMPDNDARTALAQMKHVELEKQYKIARLKFQKTKSYIAGAYRDNKAEQKIQFKAAGQRHYLASGNKDWESILSMNQSAANYLHENMTVLTAGNNMPANFPGLYATHSNNFMLAHLAFKQAEQTSEMTDAKIIATNGVESTGREMMNDAQLVFADRPDIAVKFDHATIKELVNAKTNGINGEVTDALTFQEIAGAKITIQKAGEPAVELTCDAEGHYSKVVSLGTYTVTSVAPGYGPVTHEAKVTGGYKGVDFEMEKEA